MVPVGDHDDKLAAVLVLLAETFADRVVGRVDDERSGKSVFQLFVAVSVVEVGSVLTADDWVSVGRTRR